MRPLAVVVGSVGKLPYAGMAMYWGHYILGLRELGYDVHYLERINYPGEAYDPVADTMTESPEAAVRHLATVMPRFGIGSDRTSLIDLEGICHFSGWKPLRASLSRASFALVVAEPTWFDELGHCERTAFVDGDPMFTQVEMLSGEGRESAAANCDVLFTYAACMGSESCSVPDGGRRWFATRPVVATSAWTPTAPQHDAPITALLHWAAGSEVEFGGAKFGHKDVEFRRFSDLPRRTGRRFVLAAGGAAPRSELAEAGWELTDPLGATRTVDAYARFISGSRADLGIAKNAYVASSSGWFSDRSTCFLAAGRPVLHQDTGYTRWLGVEHGVLPFTDLDSLVQVLSALDGEYERHVRGAREVAEGHFEARNVIGQMLDEAGLR